MRRLYLFRSNLKSLEYYHKYHTLEEFLNNCHDYYLLFPLWTLVQNHFDEVIIWRLSDKPLPDIIFDIEGKKFIQKWLTNLSHVLDYPSCDVSFWRGGFREYDIVTRMKPDHFGLKLYLGAGKRTFPQWGGIYDIFLIEDERDFVKGRMCLPFYKTASPYIFKPLSSKLKWDICWPCNFTQINYKGQEFFINLISKNDSLKKLKIVHCGNKPEVGKKLCQKVGIKNIEFTGSVDRIKLNEILNKSKFGLNLSNLQDGCPRISTEIIMSGTPLILRDSVRILNYYKKPGVLVFNDNSLSKGIQNCMFNYDKYKKYILNLIDNELSFENISKKNIEEWKKI